MQRKSTSSNGRVNSRSTPNRPTSTSRQSTSRQNSSNRSSSHSRQDSSKGAPNSYYSGETIPVKGTLEIMSDYGVIRQPENPENPNLPKDVYISQSQIKRFSLRMGDEIEGFARAPKEREAYMSLLQVKKVDGLDPEEARKRPFFNKLTPVFPFDWMRLETDKPIHDATANRLIDLISPIGKGQRAMIVAPPKAGKTWILQDIAQGITNNYPDITLFVALIGERPEEVTDMRKKIRGEVFASNFDEKAEQQTSIAEICLEKAKRLAEKGGEVVILMDSLTRLARAYNMVVAPSGRTLTGGFDPSALYPAKAFFGAGRAFENGGSLTIIATALVDTGSRMDDVIFEEFKGTGNMELRLDRNLSERRVFPAINIKASSTRHEEQLYDKKTQESVSKLRRMVDLLDDRESTELLIAQIKKTKTNEEFLKNLHKAN